MFPDFKSRSGKLYERACEVMPGGNTRTSLYWPPHQIYAAYASGTRVVDVDGVERVDLNNNFTALIHGHAHPVIVERVQEQIGRGACVGMATESEIALAELICSRVPSIEHIRFANSGTEAVLATIKAARAYTMRPKIAKCEGVYHGTSDLMEISNASSPREWGDEAAPASVPMSRGTPEGVLKDIIILPFNNTAASERLLKRHAHELAGVIIDPMPVRSGLIPAKREYLDMLRTFTRRNNSVLVFDEVLTFRLGYHGAQTVFGCEPDLTALGKIIGGGMPVGAVAGKREIMSVFDPREGFAAWHGGTFNGNPTTMVAGLACLELLTPEAFEWLDNLGARARRRVREVFGAARASGQVTGAGSLFRIHCTSRPLSSYRTFYPSPEEVRNLEWLMVYLLNHGFLMTKMGTGALSTVTTEAEIDQFGETLFAGLNAMKKEGLAAE
ncbi:MAG: aspartate aminotransferase family protein [Kiloniellaceae bacterium]